MAARTEFTAPRIPLSGMHVASKGETLSSLLDRYAYAHTGAMQKTTAAKVLAALREANPDVAEEISPSSIVWLPDVQGATLRDEKQWVHPPLQKPPLPPGQIEPPDGKIPPPSGQAWEPFDPLDDASILFSRWLTVTGATVDSRCQYRYVQVLERDGMQFGPRIERFQRGIFVRYVGQMPEIGANIQIGEAKIGASAKVLYIYEIVTVPIYTVHQWQLQRTVAKIIEECPLETRVSSSGEASAPVWVQLPDFTSYGEPYVVFTFYGLPDAASLRKLVDAKANQEPKKFERLLDQVPASDIVLDPLFDQLRAQLGK